jgi:hypothetical protein
MSCKHVRMQGGYMGKACHNKANHGNLCAKHKKKMDPELSWDEVFGQPGAVPSEKTKYKYSVFQWMLNLQSDFSSMSTEGKCQFKNLVAPMTQKRISGKSRARTIMKLVIPSTSFTCTE